MTGIGEVCRQVGDSGIIRTNTLGFPNATWDEVYLGFGDENAGVMGNSFNVGSPIAEATIVPAPSSLMLLGLGVLALRRRR